MRAFDATALDRIDWSSYIHAYGPALDVPGDIKDLIDPNDKVAEDALWRLFGNVYHQGTRYTATAPTIPFLAQVAIEVSPTRSAGILSLLEAIAEPSAHRILDDAMSVTEFREDIILEEQSLSAEELDVCRTYGTFPTTEIEVYDAVLDEIPGLVAKLDHKQSDIRTAMFVLLRHFPAHWQTTRDMALQSITDQSVDDQVQIAGLDCLSKLRGFAGVPSFEKVFETFVTSDASPFVRAHAALALKTNDPLQLACFLEVLEEAETLYASDTRNQHKKGWTVSQIARSVTQNKATNKTRICDALLRALPVAQANKADTGVLIEATVTALADPISPKGYFSGRVAKDLTPLEQRVVEGIAIYGSWHVGGSRFAKFTAQVVSYGLPDTPAKLQAYLKGGSLLSRLFSR